MHLLYQYEQRNIQEGHELDSCTKTGKIYIWTQHHLNVANLCLQLSFMNVINNSSVITEICLYFHLRAHYYYYYYWGKSVHTSQWGRLAQIAILCQSGHMSHKTSWVVNAILRHSLTYTIPLVGHGQGLVLCTYKSWNFLNNHHTSSQTILRVCSAKPTN